MISGLLLGSRISAAALDGYSPRAVDLVRSSLVIDMLSALNLDYSPEAFAGVLSTEDLMMFKTSEVSAFHNAAGLSGPNAFDNVLTYMAGWNGFIARNADEFLLVSNATDIDHAKKHNKAAVIMGVQNADHFRTPEDVRLFFQLGQRCSQLTYNAQNRIGSGCTDRVDGGVSDYGAAIIAKMNEVGMLIDVSHCGDRTTLDAIDISSKPIAITHSNCRALNNHPRLKTDEAIRNLAAKGGVMGISGVRPFVSAKEPTTIEDIVDHIDHVVELVGIDHVGIGSDADLRGMDHMPRQELEDIRRQASPKYAFREKFDTDQFDHPKRIFDLTDALIRRGYSNQAIGAILGGNFRRLLGSTWS